MLPHHISRKDPESFSVEAEWNQLDWIVNRKNFGSTIYHEFSEGHQFLRGLGLLLKSQLLAGSLLGNPVAVPMTKIKIFNQPNSLRRNEKPTLSF